MLDITGPERSAFVFVPIPLVVPGADNGPGPGVYHPHTGTLRPEMSAFAV